MKSRTLTGLAWGVLAIGAAVTAPGQDRSNPSNTQQPSRGEGSERFNRFDRERSSGNERFNSNSGERSDRFNSGDRSTNSGDRSSERSERFRSFRPDSSGSPSTSGTDTSRTPSSTGYDFSRSRSDTSRSDSSRSDSSRSDLSRFDPNPEQTRARYGDFAILTERNVFLRDRKRPEPQRSTTEGVARPREASYVLRGFAIQDEVRIAFIENSATGETIKAAAGDAVLQGRIKSMDLDSLEFENNGVSVRVAIGANLMGSTGGSGPSSTLVTTPSSSPPASAEEAAVMERLRLRRQQGR